LARGYATQAALNDQADFPCNSTFPTLRAFLARIIGAYSRRALAAFVARLTLGAARRLKMTCGNWAQGTRANAGRREILAIPADLLARMPQWIASSFVF
jgi:hypothetical protein